MRAGRKWIFFTAGIAALSFGLEAAEHKHGQLSPKLPDLKASWTVPGLRGPIPGTVPSASAGASAGVVPGANLQQGVANRAYPGASPALNDPPGRGGDMPDKSNKGAAPGKDKQQAPGEHAQVVAEQGAPRERPLHVIPTCD